MKQELESYFKEVNQDQAEIDELRAQSIRTAWRVSWAFGAIAALAVIAVIVMVPLKRTVTEVLILDKSTGTWEKMEKLETAVVSLDEMFHRHFLTLAWTACQNYSYETAELNYYTCAAFLSPKLQNEWAALWDNANPKSPFNVYKKNVIKIDIRSILLEKKDDGTLEVATIRYSKSNDPNRFWIAQITYKIVEPPKEERDKRINPIGFQITDYTVVPEVAGSRPAGAAR